ncbi:Lsr2 family protein [Rothia sp. P100]|uniref:histone-like nucleoid-structuring protein Lsr2 n=1 Tax=unclassified Rothia (in: high G+C Gram-positive bacteria) TaxID=2689056 RepID=UPI00203F720C|nr:Lsr2 family protein [Rothia sp. P100]MCM3509939.1 Lsr2 family protein [Rothia sp. P100]
MAQKVKIILEDDLDGGPADETVRFGLDGGSFEIDLSSANAARLRDAIRPFAAKARRVQGNRTPGRPVGSRTTAGTTKRNPEIAEIRQWAQENGYKVSSRGRIHQEIQDAYYAAKKDK